MTEIPPVPADREDGKIPELLLDKEMQESYLNYSMSVIYSRALPDVRDGLKPSQRRILVAMDDLNLGPRAKFRKCAKICGDTSGNYHPHGESVVYPTLVGMAQPFTYPVSGWSNSQGNFGAIDGSPPAAMRYTEARMSRFPATDLLADLRVRHRRPTSPNYDGSQSEPSPWPFRARFPAPPLQRIDRHRGRNGDEPAAAQRPRDLPRPCKLLIDKPEVTLDELLEMRGGARFPDRRTRSWARQGIRAATPGSRRGRRPIEVSRRGDRQPQADRVHRDPVSRSRSTRSSSASSTLAKNGQIDSISDVNDETNERVGLRIVVELKRGIDDES